MKLLIVIISCFIFIACATSSPKKDNKDNKLAQEKSKIETNIAKETNTSIDDIDLDDDLDENAIANDNDFKADIPDELSSKNKK